MLITCPSLYQAIANQMFLTILRFLNSFLPNTRQHLWRPEKPCGDEFANLDSLAVLFAITYCMLFLVHTVLYEHCTSTVPVPGTVATSTMARGLVGLSTEYCPVDWVLSTRVQKVLSTQYPSIL